MTRSQFTFTLLTFFFTSLAWSANFDSVQKKFFSAQYVEAIEELEEMKTSSFNQKDWSEWHYFNGLCYARKEKFDDATPHFSKALKYKSKRSDLHYEYGQSLYAQNELGAAQRQFAKSYDKGFKKDSALYYLGYISQLLEEYKKAKAYYSRIIKNKDATKNLRQIARFQSAESMFYLAQERKDIKRILEKYILPQYQKAIDEDPKSPIVKDIEKKVAQLRFNYRLDPNVMINGKVLPKKRYTINLSEKFSYDNNVTYSPDNATSRATSQDSFIFETNASANYILSFNQRYVITPRVAFNHLYHTERDVGNVFTNDAYTITPSIDGALEHTLSQKPATFSVGFDYAYNAQDHQEIHQKQFYSRTTGFYFQEKFRLLKAGDSTLKLKFQDSSAYQESFSYSLTTFSFTQLFQTKANHILMFLFQYMSYSYDTATASDQNTYTFRLDYIIPEIFPKHMLHLFHSLTLYDPINQSNTRGLEKAFNPGFNLTKIITNNFAMTLGYGYTKKTSDDKVNYQYDKHVTSLEAKYSF